jgi:hypothetical protein
MRWIAFTRFVVCAVAFPVDGPATAGGVPWYNGDLRTIGGATLNEQATNFGSIKNYDNVNVTSPSGWTID